jgi:hypothetical protein
MLRARGTDNNGTSGLIVALGFVAQNRIASGFLWYTFLLRAFPEVNHA